MCSHNRLQAEISSMCCLDHMCTLQSNIVFCSDLYLETTIVSCKKKPQKNNNPPTHPPLVFILNIRSARWREGHFD